MYTTVAVVGLGYVGLPVAVAFGRQLRTIGFDLDEHRLALYRQGIDPNGSVDAAQLAAATQLELTNDPASLAEAEVIMVAVPTPIEPEISVFLESSVNPAYLRGSGALKPSPERRLWRTPRRQRGSCRMRLTC